MSTVTDQQFPTSDLDREHDLPRVRRLLTDIPGPRSRELMARKKAAVAAGVGTTMPVFAARAGGGIVVDVDGNHLIDLGSGIAVTTVGNSAPRVVEAVQDQVAAFTHTCFMVTPYERLRRRGRGAQPADPGRPREAHRAVQLRRRGGRERGQDRPRPHRPPGSRGLRPRLPRAHQPHDGDDGEEHAVQARLRAVRPRGLPRAAVLPVPRRRTSTGRPRAHPAIDTGREAGRRREPRRGRHRADPGRGRVHRAGAPGFLPALAAVVPRPTASCSSPTRCRPASPAPGTGSPATTRASYPTSSSPRRASPAGSRCPR